MFWDVGAANYGHRQLENKAWSTTLSYLRRSKVVIWTATNKQVIKWDNVDTHMQLTQLIDVTLAALVPYKTGKMQF